MILKKVHFFSICKQKNIIDSGIRRRIRNGLSVKFYSDQCLLQGRKIQDVCVRPLTDVEKACSVSDLIINGTWDFSKLVSLMSPEVIQRLSACPPPFSGSGEDFLVWNQTFHGNFTVKLAYYLVEDSNDQFFHPCYKLKWKWQGAERIRVFMLLAFQKRLLTNKWHSRWSSSSSLCLHCSSQVESLGHIWRDCTFAKNMWLSLVHPRFHSSFFAANLRDWFHLNLKRDLGRSQHISWSLLFGVGIWFLWNWRNKSLFDDDFVRPSNPALVTLKTFHLFVIDDIKEIDDTLSSTLHKVWQLPRQEWIKLNVVDGAVSLSRASYGGVLRDSYDGWIAGFSCYLGLCDPHEAKEWALLKGLQIPWDMGLRKIVAETDSKNLVNLLLDNENQSYLDLVALQIKDYMQRDWDIQIAHISRDQNGVADQLAKNCHLHSHFIDSVLPL